jgi:hypothetical protein
MNKISGYSPLTAGAQWIDTEESISKSRWAQFINQSRMDLLVTLGEGFEDPTDEDIARIESKFASKFQGEFNYGKPMIVSSGTTVTPVNFSPTEMAYFQSEDQIRDMLLSLFSVPKAVVGISQDMTFGSILATLAAFCTFCLNPRFAMLGQRLTKFLAPRFERSESEHIRIWWDDCTPADPAQVNADLAEDRSQCAISPNEVRALRGRKAWEYGGDDPMIQGPGGTVPLPLNTGDDLGDLGSLVPVLAGSGAEAVEQEEVNSPDPIPQIGEAHPGIENPNGEPHKSVSKAWEGKDTEGKLESFLSELEALGGDALQGVRIYFQEGPPSLVLIDLADWFEGSIEQEKQIGRLAANLVGDEARVVWQNEGGCRVKV